LKIIFIDVFDGLNEGNGTHDYQMNDIATLEKHLAEKKKEREDLRQQIITEQSKVVQFFGGL
jgi:hypothetical protein